MNINDTSNGLYWFKASLTERLGLVSEPLNERKINNNFRILKLKVAMKEYDFLVGLVVKALFGLKS